MDVIDELTDLSGAPSNEVKKISAKAIREIENLRLVLRDALDAIELAYDFDGNVFGIEHNDVMDLILKINYILKDKML